MERGGLFFLIVEGVKEMKLRGNDRCYETRVSRYLLTVRPELLQPPVIRWMSACGHRARELRGGRGDNVGQVMKEPEFGKLPGWMDRWTDGRSSGPCCLLSPKTCRMLLPSWRSSCYLRDASEEPAVPGTPAARRRCSDVGP